MQRWVNHVLSLLFALSVVFLPVVTAYGQPVVAIPRFTVSSANPSLTYLGESLANTLTTSLAVTGKVSLVERERLDMALSELKLALSGLVDERTSSQVGKQVGASSMLLGSLSDFGGLLRIDIRIIDVATGKVLGAVTGQCTGERELPRTTENLVPEIIRIITGEATVAAPIAAKPLTDPLRESALRFGLISGISSSTLSGYDNQRHDTSFVGGTVQARLQLGPVGAQAEALVAAHNLKGTNVSGSGTSSTYCYMGRVVPGMFGPVNAALLVGQTTSQESMTIQQGTAKQDYSSTAQGVFGGVQAAVRVGSRGILSAEVRYAPRLTREHTRRWDVYYDTEEWHIGPYAASSLSWNADLALRIIENWHLEASLGQVTLTVPAQTAELRQQLGDTAYTNQVLIEDGVQTTHQYSLAIAYRF